MIDENNIMMDANFVNSKGTYIMSFKDCQLNFCVTNSNPDQETRFTLKLNSKKALRNYDMGGIDIDFASYIAKFKKKRQTRFEEKANISVKFAI